MKDKCKLPLKCLSNKKQKIRKTPTHTLLIEHLKKNHNRLWNEFYHKKKVNGMQWYAQNSSMVSFGYLTTFKKCLSFLNVILFKCYSTT